MGRDRCGTEGVEDRGVTNEDAHGASGPCDRCGGGTRSSIELAERFGSCGSVCGQAGCAGGCQRAGAPSQGERDRCGAARFSHVVPDVGGGTDRRSPSGRRDGARASGRVGGGTQLRAVGSVREAPAVDGAVGGVRDRLVSGGAVFYRHGCGKPGDAMMDDRPHGLHRLRQTSSSAPTSGMAIALESTMRCGARLPVDMAVGARSSPSAPSGASKSRSGLGEIYTIAEVAEYLKIAKKTVYKLVGSGDLPAFKAGKHWRVLRSELGNWIARKSGQKAEPRE